MSCADEVFGKGNVGNRGLHRAVVGPLAAVGGQCVLHNLSSH